MNEAEAEAVRRWRKRCAEQALVMRDQVTFYLDRARAAARAAAIGVGHPAAPALAGMALTFGKIYPRVDLSVDCPDGLRFLGEKQDFDDMLGNLIDNACKWARGEVQVRVDPPAPSFSAERLFSARAIDDDGPGPAPERRAEALRRGRRLDESKPGSGLGLAISKDLAEAYGGRLELADSPLGGLRAILLLPAAA